MNSQSPGSHGPANVAYRECMGRLILILLAALLVFMLVTFVISALKFLFWIALVALVIVGAVSLTGRMSRSRR